MSLGKHHSNPRSLNRVLKGREQRATRGSLMFRARTELEGSLLTEVRWHSYPVLGDLRCPMHWVERGG